MPKYRFGDETIEAPNRRAAVVEYNRRHADRNQEILDNLGVSIVDGQIVPNTPQQQELAELRKEARRIRVPKKPETVGNEEKGGRGNRNRRGGRGTSKGGRNTGAADDYVAASGGSGFSSEETLAKAGAGGSAGLITRESLIAMLTGLDAEVAPGVTRGSLATRKSLGGFDPALGPEYQPPISEYPNYVTTNAAIAEFIRSKPEVVAQWQDDLSAAGFMGFTADGEPKHAWVRGSPDDFTVKAFADFLEYSAVRGGFKSGDQAEQLGTGQTWQELLEERKASVAATYDLYAEDDGGGGGGGGGSNVIMPDPLAVKSLANQVARVLLGHTLGEEELNSLVEQVNAGALQADAVNQDFDVESNLVQWLKQGHAVENDAQKLVNAYSTFTDLIGPMGQRAPAGLTREGVM